MFCVLSKFMTPRAFFSVSVRKLSDASFWWTASRMTSLSSSPLAWATCLTNSRILFVNRTVTTSTRPSASVAILSAHAELLSADADLSIPNMDSDNHQADASGLFSSALCGSGPRWHPLDSGPIQLVSESYQSLSYGFLVKDQSTPAPAEANATSNVSRS